jgi:Homeodomain-like domain
MTRRQKSPLRPLTTEECQELERLSRALNESATQVARAKALLAVSQGQSYTAAARFAGRRSGDAVSQLVERFNEIGLAALALRSGGGATVVYQSEQRQQILETVKQLPNLAQTGTATWTLSTLQRYLRSQAGEEFTNVSTYTIWQVLHEANYSWQNSRSWCQTGTAKRQRKAGVATVIDPDTEAKKN